MFSIKICGITNAADAVLAVEAGADAVGLNFYEHSSRYVNVQEAEKIFSELPSGVAKVGVFVNASPNHIAQIGDRLALDYIQLHGDETPEVLAALGERTLVRAFRCASASLDTILPYLKACDQLHCRPQAVLLDAFDPDQFGGTGKTLDWRSLSGLAPPLSDIGIILAGGLNPTNVARAIAIAQPRAVDVASGVEASPGRKDPVLVRAFVASAREAFGQLRGEPWLLPPGPQRRPGM